jgi:uncharacterized membrane protein YedE/YeeE
MMYTMREARLLAPRNPVRLIAALTITLGIGQAAGPACAAWLAARTGGFDLPLIAGAAASMAGMICMLVRRLRRETKSSMDVISSASGASPSRLCQRHS